MVENMIKYEDIYINNEKNISEYINCIKVFKKFCQIYKYKKITPGLFNYYFTGWLPLVSGKYEQWRAEDMFPAVMDFCHSYDCATGAFTEDILFDLPCCIETDLKRILSLKSELLKHCNSSFISFMPYIFDFSKKHTALTNIINGDKGYYKMAEVFTNNSIVLKKVSRYNFYVRVAVDKNIIKHLRKGDILKLSLIKKCDNKCWNINSVEGCFTYYAADSLNFILKENL